MNSAEAGATQPRPHRARLLATTALVALACACTSTAARPGTGTAAAPPGTARPAAAVEQPTVLPPALPIEGYLQSNGDRAQVMRASKALVKNCMARFGFDYKVSAGTTSAPDGNLANRPRRYGMTDPAFVAKYGYHLPGDVNGSPSPPAPEPMSDAAYRVFIGDADPALAGKVPATVAGQAVPAGGCSGEAKRKLQVGDDQAPAEEINMASFHRSLSDAKVVAVFAAWSDCMKQSGYSYKSPLDPLATLTGGTLSPTEIATATADVRCKQSVDLVAVWSGVEAGIQKQMIAEKEVVLSDAKKRQEATLKLAAGTLAEPGK
ncbi:hypothetical protein [Kitasatospora sp. NPDC088134]|uniref:hypothetical protein n=1 Tax=Kitasatospora sp. NPDC088134 TaxID=3364071 RepID=UPI00381A3C7E